MQRLLAHLGFVRLDVEGLLPSVIELEAVQSRLVGQIEHLVEDDHPQRSDHRLVGAAVIFAEQRAEGLFIGQKNREGLVAIAAGPVLLLQSGNLLRREKNVQ